MRIGKQVLFIGTEFYSYHNNIKLEMERQGYQVDFFGDRPNLSSLTRATLKINPDLMKRQIKRHTDLILNFTETKKYDLIFILNGKALTRDMIQSLKEQQPQAELILYLWDAVQLYPLVKEMIPLFDRCYTFDYKDAESIMELEHLPLFYGKEYEAVGAEPSKEFKYDISSICTAHPNRYELIHRVFPEFEKKGIKIFSFYYIMKLQYLYNKLFQKEFKDAKKEEFNFVSMKEDEVVDIIKKSKCVFDIPHAKQTGLTMRTIETVGAKRKLITTNPLAERYTFYHPDNVFIFDPKNYEELYEFLLRPYVPLKETVHQSYSLESWVKRILDKDYDLEYLR